MPRAAVQPWEMGYNTAYPVASINLRSVYGPRGIPIGQPERDRHGMELEPKAPLAAAAAVDLFNTPPPPVQPPTTTTTVGRSEVTDFNLAVFLSPRHRPCPIKSDIIAVL